MNEKLELEIQCPEGYVFVRSHKRGSSVVREYCKKARITHKQLGEETLYAIPFGWDAKVAYDYIRYGKQKVKGEK